MFNKKNCIIALIVVVLLVSFFLPKEKKFSVAEEIKNEATEVSSTKLHQTKKRGGGEIIGTLEKGDKVFDVSKVYKLPGRPVVNATMSIK